MYNENLVGKNLSEATALLIDMGVTDISVIRNDTRGDYRSDCDLVVKACIYNGKATLTVSKFLLRI